jgi:hypothetical protein
MERPKPTKQLIIELCGGNNDLISSLHHGLYEIPLKEFYSYLNFDETVAFAASAWKGRSKNPKYGLILQRYCLYDVFNQVLPIGIPWFRKYMELSEKNQTLLEKLNPFEGRNLRTRLKRAEAEAEKHLREALEEPVKKHVFPCQHEDAEKARDGNSTDLVVMDFQNVYPPTRKKGDETYERQYRKMIGNFACEIARIFSDYPQEYIPHKTEEELLPTDVEWSLFD